MKVNLPALHQVGGDDIKTVQPHCSIPLHQAGEHLRTLSTSIKVEEATLSDQSPLESVKLRTQNIAVIVVKEPFSGRVR